MKTVSHFVELGLLLKSCAHAAWHSKFACLCHLLLKQSVALSEHSLLQPHSDDFT